MTISGKRNKQTPFYCNLHINAIMLCPYGRMDFLQQTRLQMDWLGDVNKCVNVCVYMVPCRGLASHPRCIFTSQPVDKVLTQSEWMWLTLSPMACRLDVSEANRSESTQEASFISIIALIQWLSSPDSCPLPYTSALDCRKALINSSAHYAYTNELFWISYCSYRNSTLVKRTLHRKRFLNMYTLISTTSFNMIVSLMPVLCFSLYQR